MKDLGSSNEAIIQIAYPITFLGNVTQPLHESEVQIDLLRTMGLFLIYYIFVDKNFFPASHIYPAKFTDKCMEN